MWRDPGAAGLSGGFETGPPPPSYGHGTWKIGTSSRSMMGLQHQPDAGIISIQFDRPGQAIAGVQVRQPHTRHLR
jgi:hypothetical protein